MADELTPPVAAFLQREMKRRKWTFRELAEFLGVPLSQAHAWATGSGEPRLKNIRKIAQKFRTKGGELVA